MKKIALRENRTENALPLNAGKCDIHCRVGPCMATVIKEAVVGQQFIARLGAIRLSDFISVMNLFGRRPDALNH